MGCLAHRLTVRACVKLARKERRRINVEVVGGMGVPEAIGAPDPAASIVERDRLGRKIGDAR